MFVQGEIPDNYICYDYLSFTSKIHSELSILDLLGLSDLSFETIKGFYGYRDRLYFDGISIHFNGRDDMGVCVEMSGKGCRNFEKYSKVEYETIFDTILDHYSAVSEKREMNITRLDVAYDDFNNVLDLALLSSETMSHNFVSRFRDWQVITGNKGAAVNHGSKSSTVYIRIYDKRLEQHVEGILPHWVRAEIQMRKESALGFLKLPKSSTINQKYFAVLNNYLRYVQPSESLHQIDLWETADYWQSFLEYGDKESIFCKPADTYSFNNLYGYVNNQLSGAINTYMDCVGVEQFLKDMNTARIGKKLNSKYHDLLYQADKHGGELLEYLKEHNLL